MGERSPDMVGTGEIKYPGWTKTSSAAWQFDIDLSRARGKNLDQKSPGPPGWGLMQQASSSLIVKKQEMLKKPNTKPRKSKHQWRNRGMVFGFTKTVRAVIKPDR